MSGTMSKADLIADLKAGLMDAAGLFTAAADADFARHLAVAARDLARFRPRTLLGTITVEPDVMAYAAPSDIVSTKYALWGVNERSRYHQWDRRYPGPLPRLGLVGNEVHLTPAPSAEQIAVLGSVYKFYYLAAHVIAADAAQTTVRAADRNLLLLRSTAEALRELAIHQTSKPVKVIQGVASQPRDGMPAALYRAFMAEFERAAS